MQYNIGIRVDGNHNLIEKNVINHAMLQLSDGGALYCFRHTKNSTYSNHIIKRMWEIQDSLTLKEWQQIFILYFK